jgi:chromosome segregation ATPase
MGKIKFSELLPLISSKEIVEDSAAKLISEILILSDRLENIEEQTFYFKKGFDSAQERLELLKKKYNKLINEVNNTTVDELLSRISEREERVEHWSNSKSSYTIKGMAVYSIKSYIEYLRKLIFLKGKYGNLKPIEDYSQEELIQFFK